MADKKKQRKTVLQNYEKQKKHSNILEQIPTTW